MADSLLHNLTTETTVPPSTALLYLEVGSNTDTKLQLKNLFQGSANAIVPAGSSTGNPVTLTATGSDTDISIRLTPKGINDGNFLSAVIIGSQDDFSIESNNVNPLLVLQGGEDAADFTMRSAGNVTHIGPAQNFFYSRGTLAVPTAAQIDDIIGSQYYTFFDGAVWQDAAWVEVKIDGAAQAEFAWYTNSLERFAIHGDGAIVIPGFTSNGFLKTSGGDGTLSVDTATYLTAAGVAPLVLGTNLVEQYNSTNAQTLSIYYTRTDGSNYRRITYTADQYAAKIKEEIAGSGSATRSFVIGGPTTGATVGTDSIAIGAAALANATGGFNVAIGTNALNAVNGGGGVENVAVGYSAGSQLAGSSSLDNTAIGTSAMLRLSTSSANNTFVGANTGLGISSGSSQSGNIYLGFSAGYRETGSAKLFVDNQTRATEAAARTDSIIYGVMSATMTSQTLALNAAVSVGVSLTSPIVKITAPLQAISTGGAAVTGNATLVGGTVTVSTTRALTGSSILLTRKTSGGTIGTSITYTISNGTSFTITSDNILDTSTFTWVIIDSY